MVIVINVTGFVVSCFGVFGAGLMQSYATSLKGCVYGSRYSRTLLRLGNTREDSGVIGNWISYLRPPGLLQWARRAGQVKLSQYCCQEPEKGARLLRQGC